MITILLADDDLLSLNRITGLADWNRLGYEIVGQTRNGKDCLKAVAVLKPDILILDIDMPIKNGVEVCKTLKELKSPVKILILSNYDTFTFVRDAMKNGACDYLLKHEITAPVLTKKLSEIGTLIAQEGAEHSRISFLSHMADRECLKHLIDPSPPQTPSLRVQCERFSSQANVLAVMQITNFILVTHFSSKLNRDKLIHSILTLSDTVFKTLNNGLILHMEYGQFAILFHYETETSSQEVLTQSAAHMRLLASNIHKLFGLTALWQLSHIIHKTEGFRTSYRQIVSQLEKQRITAPQSQTLHHSVQEISKSIDDLTKKALTDSMSHGDTPKTLELLVQVLSPYQEEDRLIPQPVMEQLLEIGIRYEKLQNLSLSSSNEDAFQNINFSRMNGKQTLDFFTFYFRELLQTAAMKDTALYSTHVRQAIAVIHEQYHKDLSLTTLADLLGITPTHLSHLFKRETGTSFIDYLTDYRIARARQLILNSELGLKEIAKKTGFNGYNYFLKVYKDRTGKTPSQELGTPKEGD